MMTRFHSIAAVVVSGLLLSAAWAQQAPPPSPVAEQERIVSEDEADDAAARKAVLPLRVLSAPHRAAARAFESGLITVERKHLRERLRLFQDRMREMGIAVLFGGMGEQTGFGGGGSYTIGSPDRQHMTTLARATFAGYQEYDIQWGLKPPKTDIVFEMSYQWRPRENFYGLGNDSLDSQHSNFALRQAWAGAHVEISAPKHFKWGFDYKFVEMTALAGTNRRVARTTDVFPGLAGMGERVRLHTGGVYADLDLSQGEYGWTGRGHFAASYQHGVSGKNLRYFSYLGQVEGRMPVTRNQSAFVGQVYLNLNRERGGSDEIPFYMQPRLGGSSSLRGYALDRFYGENLMMLSLDYRYAIHPNFQAAIFHDAGQIFDRRREVTWFNWHRNYGVSLRIHSHYKTIMRLEYGHGRDGFDIHLTFGDRTAQPLAGPVRYGTYRR